MDIRPEEAIGYWLFYSQRCLEYAFLEILKRCCVEQGKSYVVTPPQWGVLSMLFENDGLPIGAISQKRGFDAPTITGIVKRLEQNGLLERRHDREDRRVVKVYLTTEGKEMMPLLMAEIVKFDATVKQGFSEVEEKDLIGKMQQIIANLANVAPGMGDRFHLLPGHFYEAE